MTTAVRRPRSRAAARWVLGVIAVIFGLATVAAGSRTLLDGLAPDQIGVVVAFNVAAGVAYVAAGAVVLAGNGRAVPLARVIAAATVLVFLAFGVHAALGGAFQTRTVAAMTLRTLLWGTAAFTLPRLLRRESPS
jgi:hypothetical protein